MYITNGDLQIKNKDIKNKRTMVIQGKGKTL